MRTGVTDLKRIALGLTFLAAGAGTGLSIAHGSGATSARDSPLGDLLRSKYRMAKTVDQIPQPVRTALFRLMKYDPRLANPAERFNATDVVDSRFPMRRLISAGGTDSSWFVYYEHGGRGYIRRVVLFTVKAGAVACRCAGHGDSDAREFSDLRDEFRRGLVTCDPCDPSGYF